MTGLHRKLLRDLKVMRFQIFTIAILIMAGLSVFISSWNSFQSLQQSKDAFYEQYGFADIFAQVERAPQYVANEIARLEGVERVESRIVKEGLVDVPGQVEPALGQFVSLNGDHQGINLIYLRQGHLPEAGDRDHLEVVVHEAFAVAHQLKLGDVLRVLLDGQQRKMMIVGIGISPEYVYCLNPVSPLPDDLHFGVFWMRKPDLESLTGLSGAFNSLQLKIAAQAPTPEIKRRIDLLLKPYGKIEVYDRARQLSNMFVEDEIREQKIMAIVMPSIFMAVATFILNVILSRMIVVQTPQIATLKSLGYGNRSLMIHYFQMVTVFLLAGIVPSIFAGIQIGHWYTGLYAEFFRFPSIDFSLSWQVVAFSFVVGLLPGWAGTARILLQVFSLRPAEALRPPNPPEFHKGLLEKIGLFHRLSVFSKMIIRSLFFRPVRLTLSVLGMAMALGIMINGSFWIDVIDFMMNRQFYEMQRQDLTIRLLHPKPVSVFSELSQITGVIMMEGARTVPARLQYKNHKMDTGILGYHQGTQMNRVMDLEGNVIQPVAGGLILSRYFESAFGIKPGDFVNVQVLEGSQKELRLPVIKFVDDLIGQQIYALKDDLHKWLDEESVVDTIQMKIDPRFAEAIYVALKQKPEVISVNIRQLLLNSFTKTIAGMILTFTFVLYFFAVAIAGAVMFNTARVGLSEKTWDLASLRILGYGVGAAFELLIIEMGLQVLMALVPGLLFGYGLSYLSTHLIHNETFKFPLVIEAGTYGSAVLIILFTFVASCIFVWRNIYTLDLSKALKSRE